MDNEKEKPQVGQVILDGLLTEPNNLDINITPERFIELLRYFNIGKEFSPIAWEFGDNREVRIRVKNSAGDAMAIYEGNKDQPISTKTFGYLILEPADILKRIGAKYSDSSTINIVAKENQKILISDDKGNSNKITPLDKTQVTIQKISMTLHINDDGWFCWKTKKDGAFTQDEKGNQLYTQAATKIKIDAKELQKAILDMSSTDCDYTQFHFSKDGSYSQSGHLGKAKSNYESKTMLEAEIEGDDLEITLQSVFVDLIKMLNGNIEIFGTPKTPAIIIVKKLDYGILKYMITEPTEI